MRIHHRKCYADTPIVHYTWFALARTFCGLPRINAVPFTSHHTQCVVCIATEAAFPERTDLTRELDIARERNGFNF